MHILFKKEGKVLIAKLNRPRVNALSSDLMYELIDGLLMYDKNQSIGCNSLTGSTKVLF